jgi:hypothetical protein
MTTLDDLPDTIWMIASVALNRSITNDTARLIANDIRSQNLTDDDAIEVATAEWLKAHPGAP